VSPETKVAVQVDGRTLTLTNLAKVLYPQTGFTKAEVLDYYQRVAPFLLPHIAGRPLTLKRYPEARHRAPPGLDRHRHGQVGKFPGPR
jgi:DNA primase